MAITYDEKQQLFTLDTGGSRYVLKVYAEGYLLCLHYGSKNIDIDVKKRETRPRNASFSPSHPVLGEVDFTPDTAPIEYGCNGAGDFRISACSVRNDMGNCVTDLRYVGHRIFRGKPEISQMPSTYIEDVSDATTLEIDMLDTVTNVEATLVYTVYEEYPVLTKSVRFKNLGEASVTLEKAFSACFDFPDMNYDMISLWGRHYDECHIERKSLGHGVQGVYSNRGASSHVHNPFVALARRGSDEQTGEVFGFNLVYSGNFSAMAECDFNSSTRLLMGINPEGFSWRLPSGEIFETPEVVSVYSEAGLGEMSRIYHRFYNRFLIRGRYKTEKRPILINSWEAAYFDFNAQTLLEFADSASELGIEMLVMDDGWFGHRNDETSSLGDWYVNTDKIEGGLVSLVEGIHAKGLKFGIWYEPEMISPDSQLFSLHPDWCVRVPGREPMIGRNQYVLDFSRKDVRDYIWEQMYRVLSSCRIDYLKWDFNRNISDAGSLALPKEGQDEFFHRFVLGTYDLLNRLTQTFPDMLVETCSGGGGRFDAGMLYYSPQIWTSDNTNAIDRVGIQFGTSLCYPAGSMGAHVSACPSTSYKTKGDVALWGTFGYELDPRKLTDDEKELFREQVREYHKFHDLIHKGDLYRLRYPSPEDAIAAWSFVSPDKRKLLLTVFCYSPDDTPLSICCDGLNPDFIYKNDEGIEYSGKQLMQKGIDLIGGFSEKFSTVKYFFEAI